MNALKASPSLRTISTFSCDIAYSDSPAASRAASRSANHSKAEGFSIANREHEPIVVLDFDAAGLAPQIPPLMCHNLVVAIDDLDQLIGAALPRLIRSDQELPRGLCSADWIGLRPIADRGDLKVQIGQLKPSVFVSTGEGVECSVILSTFSCDIAYSPQPSKGSVCPASSNQYSRKLTQRPSEASRAIKHPAKVAASSPLVAVTQNSAATRSPSITGFPMSTLTCPCS